MKFLCYTNGSLALPILYIASEKNKTEIFEYLLSTKYNELTNNDQIFYFLDNAIENSQLKVVQYIIDQGFPINYTESKNGYSLFHAAGYKGNIEIFDYLISQGADINLLTGDESIGFLILLCML